MVVHWSVFTPASCANYSILVSACSVAWLLPGSSTYTIREHFLTALISRVKRVLRAQHPAACPNGWVIFEDPKAPPRSDLLHDLDDVLVLQDVILAHLNASVRKRLTSVSSHTVLIRSIFPLSSLHCHWTKCN